MSRISGRTVGPYGVEEPTFPLTHSKSVLRSTVLRHTDATADRSVDREARLDRDSIVHDELARQLGEDAKFALRLHPPSLRALGMKRKISLGRWFSPAFALLHTMRCLRGTTIDPFGYAKVRRVERRLVDEYEFTIWSCAAALDAENFAHVVRIAELPDLVRGYEEIKLRSVETHQRQRSILLRAIGIESADLVGRR